MEHLRKILLLDLPQSVQNALLEQVKKTDGLAAGASLSDGPYDLILCGNPPPENLPAAVPVLSLGLQRRERLGVLLRQALQILEEPAPWLLDFRLGPYVFRPADKILLCDDGREIALTDRETDILVYLARQESPVPREDLLKHVWRFHESVDTHTLETHIYRLRQKMEEKAETPQILLTVEGGYSLRCGREKRSGAP